MSGAVKDSAIRAQLADEDVIDVIVKIEDVINRLHDAKALLVHSGNVRCGRVPLPRGLAAALAEVSR